MASTTSLGVGVVIGGALSSSLKNAFDGAEKRSWKLGSAIRTTERRAGHMQQRLGRMVEEQRRAGAGSERLADRIRNVGLALDRSSRRAAGYRRELRRIGDAQRMQRAREGLGRARVAAGGAIGGAYAASRLISSALQRDEAAVRLKTVLVTDDLEGDLDRGLEHARELVRDKKTLHSEVELIDVQYALNSAGFQAEAARLGSTVASQLATVTRGAPERTAGVLATAVENFGAEFKGPVDRQMRQVGDILAHAQLTYKFSDFGQLGEGLKSAAPAAIAARLPLAQLATVIGKLNNLAMDGSEAGTGLRSMLVKLPVAAQKLGFEISRDAENNLDLIATLESLETRLSRYGDDVDRVGLVLADAFGGDEPVQALQLLRSVLGEMQAEVDATAGSAGTIDEKFTYFTDSASGKVKNLVQNLVILGRTIGEAPDTTTWTDWANEQVVDLSRTIGESERLRKSIVGVGLALGGLAVGRVAFAAGRFALEPLYRGVRLIGDAVGRRRGGGRAVGGGLFGRRRAATGGRAIGGRGFLGRGVAAGPKLGAAAATKGVGRLGAALKVLKVVGGAVFGLLGIKLLAIGGAVYLIYKHWGAITGFFKGVMGEVGAIFKPAVDAWGKVFTDFSWRGVGSAIMTTLASGVTAMAVVPYNAMKGVLLGIRDLLPFSDARIGPLSGLTASGGAVLRTIGDGVSRAGPGALRRPLTRQLAAAAAGLTLAVTPPAVAPLGPVTPAPVVQAMEPVVAPLGPVTPAPVVQAMEPVVAPLGPVTPAPVVQAMEPVVAPLGPVTPAPVVQAMEPVVAPLGPVTPAPVVQAMEPVVAPVDAPAAPSPLDEVAPPSTPPPAPAPVVNNNYYDDHSRITIQAAPGEDVRRLADRLMAEIDHRRAVRRERVLAGDEA